MITFTFLNNWIVPDKCTECKGFHDEPQCAAVCPVDCCVDDEDNVDDNVDENRNNNDDNNNSNKKNRWIIEV